MSKTKKRKLVHCPYCPDQGWYQDTETAFEHEYIYDENGNAVSERVTPVPVAVQVQCEFCWTTPNSYFNNQERQPKLKLV